MYFIFLRYMILLHVSEETKENTNLRYKGPLCIRVNIRSSSFRWCDDNALILNSGRICCDSQIRNIHYCTLKKIMLKSNVLKFWTIGQNTHFNLTFFQVNIWIIHLFKKYQFDVNFSLDAKPIHYFLYNFYTAKLMP